MTQNLERLDQQARLLEARLHIEALRENELSQLPRTLESVRNQLRNAQTELPSVDISRLWLAVESRVTTGDQAGELRREATEQLRVNARPAFSGVAAIGVLASSVPGGDAELTADFAAEFGGERLVTATQQIEPDSLPGGFGFSLDTSLLNLDLDRDLNSAFADPTNLLADGADNADLGPSLAPPDTSTTSTIPESSSAGGAPPTVSGDDTPNGETTPQAPASDSSGGTTNTGPSFAVGLGGYTDPASGSAAPSDVGGTLGDSGDSGDSGDGLASTTGETGPPAHTTVAGAPPDAPTNSVDAGTGSDEPTAGASTDESTDSAGNDSGSAAGGSADKPTDSTDAGGSSDEPTTASAGNAAAQGLENGQAGSAPSATLDDSGRPSGGTDAGAGSGTGSDEPATASAGNAAAQGLENGQAGSAPSATLDDSGKPSGSDGNGARAGAGSDELNTASASNAATQGIENGQAGSAPSATLDDSGRPSGGAGSGVSADNNIDDERDPRGNA